MDDENPERDRMYQELGDLCKKWRRKGIESPTIAARLMSMALAASEFSQIPMDTVLDLVKTFYGMGDKSRPKAQA